MTVPFSYEIPDWSAAVGERELYCFTIRGNIQNFISFNIGLLPRHCASAVEGEGGSGVEGGGSLGDFGSEKEKGMKLVRRGGKQEAEGEGERRLSISLGQTLHGQSIINKVNSSREEQGKGRAVVAFQRFTVKHLLRLINRFASFA